jgi:hypothetical protein
MPSTDKTGMSELGQADFETRTTRLDDDAGEWPPVPLSDYQNKRKASLVVMKPSHAAALALVGLVSDAAAAAAPQRSSCDPAHRPLLRLDNS